MPEFKVVVDVERSYEVTVQADGIGQAMLMAQINPEAGRRVGLVQSNVFTVNGKSYDGECGRCDRPLLDGDWGLQIGHACYCRDCEPEVIKAGWANSSTG